MMQAVLRVATIVAVALAAGCAGLTDNRRVAGIEDADRLARQVLVTVRQDSEIVTAMRGAPSQRYQYRRGYGATSSVERELSRLAREHELQRVRGWPISALDVYCAVFELAQSRDIGEVVAALQADPAVDLAQPMNTFQSLASRYDDPYFDLQGSLRLLDVENAHTMATGKGVLVAVIDSSVDRAHPDLRASVSMQRDLVGGRRLRQHPEVHGTAVAGVIASAANNAVGIIGVAPDARIAALRACWSERDTDSTALCSSFTLAQALELALELEPDIINLSVAGPEDPLLGLLIDRATERGIAVVAAEETFDTRLSFPASHRGVLAARSAADQRDDGAESSVPAPSSEVLTTTPDREYAFLSGSSLAAAHISGVVALLLQRYPDLTHGELLERLHASMMTEHGAVSVNACRALAGQATEEAHCLQP